MLRTISPSNGFVEVGSHEVLMQSGCRLKAIVDGQS